MEVMDMAEDDPDYMKGDPDANVISKAYVKGTPRHAAYDGEPLRPGGVRLTQKAQKYSMDLLQDIFRGNFHGQLKAKLTAEDEQVFKDAFNADEGTSLGADTYGEICPAGLMTMLWSVGAKPGDRFYDLGAGPGKTVALAWLAGMHATGVELSKARWMQSCYALRALRNIDDNMGILQEGEVLSENLPKRIPDGMDHLWGSTFDLDFLDADVVFISSVMFSSHMMASISVLARWCKLGTKIISYHHLPGDEFEDIGVLILPTSWTEECRWLVQQVCRHPGSTEERPQDLRRPDEFSTSKRCVFKERGVMSDSCKVDKDTGGYSSTKP